jgi:uncharacterized protein (TIGR02246 family)
MGQIETLLKRLEDAWNRGDFAAYSACYAEDASYVSRAGDLWEGREQIERIHRAAFEAGLKGTELRISVKKATPLSESVTAVHVDVELKGATAVWAVATFVVRDGLITNAHTSEI